MGSIRKIAAAVLAAAAIPTVAGAATLGGFYFAVQYDYREFFSIADGKNFQVILAGNPFPGMNPDDVARQLLPQMQAHQASPNLTFTYDKPLEPPHPCTIAST
jgi:hypothetical protein